MANTKRYWRRSTTTMNIILIGMRGSGKSTIARKLSKKLGKPHIEVDSIIAKEAGMTIPEIVKTYGWEYFRNLETETTKQICTMTEVIISTGGGVVTRSENIVILKKSGKIFYLRAPIYTLLRRVGKDANRPALTNKKSPEEEMKEIFKKRNVLYEQTATSIIDTDKKTANAIVNVILNLIQDPNKKIPDQVRNDNEQL